MKRTIFPHFIILSIVIFSCKKSFIETPPEGIITRQEYVKDLATMREYLNGIYAQLGDKVYFSLSPFYGDLASDNIKPANGFSFYNPHYSWTQIATEDIASGSNPPDVNMNSYWTAHYKAIRMCNFVIEDVAKYRSENAVVADDLKGQAFAIRALLHHSLVNVFAQPPAFTVDASHQGIPYVVSTDYTEPLTRQPVAEFYIHLIEDLDNAIQLIDPSHTSRVFMTKDGARALLARVFLFKGDWISAKNIARQVCNSVPLMSGADYPSKLFTSDESEALFQIPPYDGQYSTRFPSFFYRQLMSFVSTSDLGMLLQENPNDNRKSWVELSGGNYNVTKFPAGVVPGIGNPNNAYYLTVLRSSEMYLTAAEAYAKLGGMEDSARYFLDAIRIRADGSLLPSVATGTALVDSIAKERRKELSFEGLRTFDLLRTKTGIIRTDSDVPANAKTLPFPSSKAISPIHAVDVAYYHLDQNPGY